MSSTSYRGHVRGGVVVFEGDERPPEGLEVVITPKPGTVAEADDEAVGGTAFNDEEPARTDPDATADDQVEESLRSLSRILLEFAGKAVNLPPDMAEQHDHYLYGTPKR